MKTRFLFKTLAAFATLAFSPAAHAADLDLAGIWQATSTSQEAERNFTWTFAKEGESWTASSQDHAGGDERKFDRVTLDGKKVTMEIDYDREGHSGVLRVVTEGSDAGKLEGKWSVIGSDGTVHAEGGVTAQKETAFVYAGLWKSKSTLPDGEVVAADVMLKGANAALEGAITTAEGVVIEIAKATADGKNLRFEFKVEIEGKAVPGVVEASPDGEDKLAGVWILKGDDGGEVAKGEWQATRAETPSLAGDWNVSATTPDGGAHTSTMTIALDGEAYGGKFKSSEGEEMAFTSVKVEGGHLVVTLKLERDGQSGTITVDAD